jgi:two-component system chemotaxis sensor kinase CheA
MSVDMRQFSRVFFEEAAEHLASMEALLLALDTSTPSDDDLNAIFRCAHSIKGGAATFGFPDMAELTHVLEGLLDKLRKRSLALTAPMVDALLRAGDVIRGQIAAHRGDAASDPQSAAAMRALLEGFADTSRPFDAAQDTPFDADAGFGLFEDAPGAPPAAADREPGYGLFEEAPGDSPAAAESDPSFGFFGDAPDLSNVEGPGVPTTETAQSADPGYGFFDAIDEPAASGRQEVPASPGAIDPEPIVHGRRASDRAGMPEVNRGRRAADRVAAQSADAASIRVSVEKVDRLINLVGELVITQAMLAQSASQVDRLLYEKLHNGITQLERDSRGLQEAVLSMRMMPISFVFQRFPRMVRDLAQKLGKKIELRTLGESTELDRGVIERIADPLTHLVRNSLDHGIESLQARLAAGKPEKGTLTLRAFQQGGNIVIEVSDDGAGIERRRILDKAKSRGMAVSEAMSDQEVFGLIFEPGFSTAEVVTDVSGRGVGMDVVRRNIGAMGGSVEIDSRAGAGTRISIRLPLTLAILDGLSVQVGAELYVIPLTYITESLLPAKRDMRRIAGEGLAVRVRGEYLPVLSAACVFGSRSRQDCEEGILVVLEAEGTRIALAVDALIGEHQVVVKSLETNYRKVQGVAGATIMGDGRVALILDAPALVRMTRVRERAAA